MIKSIMRYKIICLLLLLLQTNLIGQTFEKSRSISKSFYAGKDTELQVSNKYGNIQLETWEKDSVKVDISLKVISSKESKLNMTIDYIDFQFNATKHYIIAQTAFEGQGTFWSDVKDLAGTVFNSNTKTQIDYKIYLPASLKISIENKYGNIYISDYAGEINIKLSNGDLKAHQFTGQTTIAMSFANADIDELSKGKFDISYFSELHIDKCDSIRLDSKSSKIYIKDFNALDINSNRDRLSLGEGNSISGKLMFSHTEIEKLNSSLKTDTHYGDFEINSLGGMIKGIDISAASTDFVINKLSSQAISVDITYNENAGLYYQDELSRKRTSKIETDKKLVNTTGLLGTDSASTINLRAKVLSGSLTINNK
ncbi:MAG: hypothetical protein GXO88_07020 [Chlorobi bacterium]|nr:hypothetical protein [Chlorobiota bacterium]